MIGNAYPQANFDPRILNLPMPQAWLGKNPGALSRGYITQTASITNDPALIYACAFLYNPGQVEVTHALDPSSWVTPQFARSTADTGQFLVGLQATLNFTLMFDRTYEVNTAGGSIVNGQGPTTYPSGQIPVANQAGMGSQATDSGEDPRVLGVRADINALYRICGINAPLANQAYSDAQGNPYTGNLTGPMQQVPAWCYFGNTGSGNNLAYFGYLSELDIQYTHFTQDLTPMRCTVAVSFTLLPIVSPPSS